MRLSGKRFGDLHTLAVSDRQHADPAVDIEFPGVQGFEQDFRFARRLTPINGAKFGTWHMSGENVFGDGQLRIEAKLLVDSSDPFTLRLTRARETNRFPIDFQIASVRRIDPRNNFDQGRFPGAILTE